MNGKSTLGAGLFFASLTLAVSPLIAAETKIVPAEKAELRQDRTEIRRDRQELKGDRHERRKDRRELRSDRVFSQVDQLEIVKTLVDDTQARNYGDVGIDTSAVGTSGVLRDARYLVSERHNLAQRIEEMGRRDDGFDVEIEPGTRALQIWHPAKGTDRSTGEDAVVFDARNVTDTTVSWSVAPGDVATDTIAVGTSAMDTVTGTARDDQLITRFGVADYSETFDGVSEYPTIASHAAGLLYARNETLLIPGPDVRVSTDVDLDRWDVGDTIAYQLHDGLGVSGAFRVRKRTISVDNTGAERVSVEFA